MNLVITGASGFIGRNIMPILKPHYDNLLLVGRSEKRLQEQFPEMKVSGYETLATSAKGFDTLVHLAVRNNNTAGSIEQFRETNVEHLESVIHSASAAGIKTFIYITTLHVNEKGNLSPYAQSKKEAEELLSGIENMVIVKLRLPAAYGVEFSGKLGLLTRIPKFLRPLAFKVAATLKPTVHVDRIAAAVIKASSEQENTEMTVSDRQNGNWFYAAVKRIIDLSFAIFVVVFLWWILIIAWVAIKLSSPGPGLFLQQRVGKNGKSFICYKFRTMVVGTKQVGTHDVAQDSITAIGRFLRRSKIDELPQIWNIFKNEMSLVGPRPCLISQKTLIAERNQRGVLDQKGGITGWAQIHGVAMNDPIRLAKLDAEYLDLCCLPLDIKIIIATAIGRGQGDKVPQI